MRTPMNTSCVAVLLAALTAVPAPSWSADAKAEVERHGIEAGGVFETTAVSPPADHDFQQLVPIRLVVSAGDTLGGVSPVTTLGTPSAGDAGVVAVSGAFADGDEFLLIEDAVAWTSSGAGITATSIEAWTGVNADGSEFIFSVVQDPGGLDSVVTAAGTLLAEGDPAPVLPGLFITFASRALMTASGVAYWVSGYTDTPGTSTQARAIYRAVLSPTPVIEKVIGSGDPIGGFTLDSSFDFDYYVSDNDQHRINVLDTTEDSAADFFVAVDGVLVLREGDPIGPAENWDNFDNVQINNAGRWIVTGDTDGDTATDEFLAVDGTIVVREGDVVAGVTLGAFSRLASVNDRGQIAFVWDSELGSADEVVFVADNPTAVAEACVVLRPGWSVDIDGDGLGDATVTDTNTALSAAQSLQFQEDGWVYLDATLDFGGGSTASIIGVRSPCVFHDGFESGNLAGWSGFTP